MGVTTSENASPIEISDNIKQIAELIGITSISFKVTVTSKYRKDSDGSTLTNSSKSDTITITKNAEGKWVANKTSVTSSYNLSYTAGKYNAQMSISSITVS